MIIVNLKGGAGNQLFQYALGRHLADMNDDTLKLDVGGLDRANKVGDIYRPFALESFNVIQDLATPEEVKRFKYPLGIISKAYRYISFKLSRDKNTTFNPSVFEKTGDIYLDGFWQSPRFFEAIRDTLLSELTLKTPLSPTAEIFAKQIKSTGAVSLHVRRGDYAKNSRVSAEFGPCSLDYYRKAMAELEKILPNPTYFVFSDDMPWVKENLPVGETATLVRGANLTDAEELTLMSMCQHNIIANSSFSWWGAWLNQNPDKIVIAPTPWFDKVPYDEHLIPETWTKISKS